MGWSLKYQRAEWVVQRASYMEPLRTPWRMLAGPGDTFQKLAGAWGQGPPQRKQMAIFSKVSGPTPCHLGECPETYNPDLTEQHLLTSTQSQAWPRASTVHTILGFLKNPWAVTTGSKQFGFQNPITESESTTARTKGGPAQPLLSLSPFILQLWAEERGDLSKVTAVLRKTRESCLFI